MNILIDECHNLNEEIHSLLVQSTLNSMNNSKIITLSKRSELIISNFIKTLIKWPINLSIKIGNCVDSSELKLAFAEIITNIYNVYYSDSRLIDNYYNDIIQNHIFGSEHQPINFIDFITKDIFNGKRFINDFVNMLLFASFQDNQWYNYAIEFLVNGKFESKNERIHNILVNPKAVPKKIKIYITTTRWRNF